ncbi:sigma-70 family RNA polymerase sigma factor [Schlesneria paludicola]|uniref:sigma-70 family RNA polymerase sigma factor n=1 Tax=Schlesneria paludicola TaxID=360056 RepID=UPI00029A7D20|nr:sigma-70 family RNA polymerase sigma factor [Schlesneria paludicola]
MSASTTINLKRCLQSLSDHDPSARGELLAYAERRLKILADRMFFRYRGLNYREHADDLLQEAMIRLWKSLEAVGPTTVEEFMGLAALQIRRALNDMVRNHFRQNNGAAVFLLSASDSQGGPVGVVADSADMAPEDLMRWTEFHAAVDQLEEPDRTAFDLLYYHELPQSEVAELMKVSDRQIRRYWLSARRTLLRMLDGSWPKL